LAVDGSQMVVTDFASAAQLTRQRFFSFKFGKGSKCMDGEALPLQVQVESVCLSNKAKPIYSLNQPNHFGGWSWHFISGGQPRDPRLKDDLGARLNTDFSILARASCSSFGLAVKSAPKGATSVPLIWIVLSVSFDLFLS
jgi:hypothetical protein